MKKKLNLLVFLIVFIGLFYATEFAFGLGLSLVQALPATLIIATLAASAITAAITKDRVHSRQAAIFQLGCLITLSANAIQQLYNLGAFSQVLAVVSIFIVLAIVLLITPMINTFQKLFLNQKPRFTVPFFNQIMDTFLLLLTYAFIFLIFYIAAGYEVLPVFIFIVAIVMAIVSAIHANEKRAEIKLKREDEPKLFEFIEKIAHRFDMPVPKEIVLVPDATIAVTGVFRKKMIIGLVALRQLKEEEFEGIIAHEFGHFYGKDTLFGGLVYSFSNSLDLMGKFIRMFSRVHIIAFVVGSAVLIMKWILSLVTLLYMRQREYFADAYAAQIVGPKTFITALERYIGYTYFFQVSSVSLITKIFREKKSFFKNLYQLFASKVKEKDYLPFIEAERKRGGQFLSSHPSLSKRTKLVNKLPQIEPKKSKATVSALFKQLEKYEHDFSGVYSLITLKNSGSLTYSDIQQMKGESS